MPTMTDQSQIRLSLTTRLARAWATFTVKTIPDPDAFKKWVAKREARIQEALSKLDGFDRALVESVAGGSADARGLLGRVMPAIEKLELEDQAWIAKHIVRGYPSAMLYADMKALSLRVAKAVSANEEVA